MVTNNNKTLIYSILSLILATSCLAACRQKASEEPAPVPHTQVTITHVEYGNISRRLEFLAQSDYLREVKMVAPVSGYIVRMHLQQGDRTGRHGFLFSMKSNEQAALGMQVAPVTVSSSIPGIITAVYQQQGSYVTEGTPVCDVVDATSLVFRIHIPYDERRQVHSGMPCTLLLPEGTRLKTTLARALLNMDDADQTEDFIARVHAGFLPAGLVAKAVIWVKSTTGNHQILPVGAVQSDDNLSRYWIFRLTSDSTVEKIPVITGNGNDRYIEILFPKLNPSDRIVNNGAYALTEQSIVKMVR